MNKTLLWVLILLVVAIVAFLLGRNTALQPVPEEQTKVQKIEPSFPGAEKHEVTKEDAIRWIKNYQKQMVPKGKASAGFIKGGAFDRAILDKILAQPGCKQLRFYYALDDDAKQTLVVVGVDTAGKDMMGVIGEKIYPCPPFCPFESEFLK
ncbi:MAG: hypothetical protein N3A63_08150 [Bacteroidetes bacterium]|nr:hypothetical protein [Bacteroidota bacterium]